MIKNVLTHVDGVELYGIVSIVLFFVCFTIALFRALRLRKTHLDHMGALPLHEESSQSQPETRHE